MIIAAKMMDVFCVCRAHALWCYNYAPILVFFRTREIDGFAVRAGSCVALRVRCPAPDCSGPWPGMLLPLKVLSPFGEAFESTGKFRNFFLRL